MEPLVYTESKAMRTNTVFLFQGLLAFPIDGLPEHKVSPRVWLSVFGVLSKTLTPNPEVFHWTEIRYRLPPVVLPRGLCMTQYSDHPVKQGSPSEAGVHQLPRLSEHLLPLVYGIKDFLSGAQLHVNILKVLIGAKQQGF